MTAKIIFSSLSARLGANDRRHHPTNSQTDNRTISNARPIATTVPGYYDFEEDPWFNVTDGTTETPAANNPNDMWEDNNPLSYDRRSSNSSFLQQDYDSEHTVSSPIANPVDYDHDNDPPEFLARPNHVSSEESKEEDDEDEDEDEEEYRRQRRTQGYSTKVEQYLIENRDKEITITKAGKNHEGSGGYIVYTIKTGDLEVRRRYSEFESLRKNLSLLHPCLIVPPIPEKHQVTDYVTAPTSAKENVNIIDHRKRMLCVFLNRCRRMKEIRSDTVFLRFLDPNASWSEVLTSPPISNLPKHHLKAPPLNPANPSPAHAHLPVPSASAKLKHSPPLSSSHDGSYMCFPPMNHKLSESELDPYFTTYEATTRTYEALLTGSIERVNRRILKRFSELSLDYNELGARYNAFSLNESANLAVAIEKIGKAVDDSCYATVELSDALGSGFAEPLRESAQFANVVQKVLRYRVLKRVQEEMAKDLLQQKRALLESLEKSEAEAKRIDQYIHSATLNPPTTSTSSADDVESLDSADGFAFPPTHSSSPPRPINNPKPNQGQRSVSGSSSQPSPPVPTHKKSVSFSSPTTASSALSSTASALTSPSGFLAKGFGRLNYAIHGIVDVDPERTRRDNIGKTKEALTQLEKAIVVAEEDVKSVSAGVLKDLRRFQAEKVGDLRSMMMVYAKCHIEWAKKNLESWEEAKLEVEKIKTR